MSRQSQITLPSLLKKWVDQQVARKGFGSADAYVADVLSREKAFEARERIDGLLVEALDSGPSTPMTAEDWRSIRESERRRFMMRRSK